MNIKNDDYNGQSQPDDEDNQQYNNKEDDDQQPQYNQYGGEDDDENNNQNQRDNSGEYEGEGNDDNQNEFNDYEDAKQNEMGDDDDSQDNKSKKQRYASNGNKDLQGTNYSSSQFGAINTPNESRNYKRNKEILDNFFKNFSGEVQNYFSEFKQKQIQDNQEDGIDDNDNFYSQQKSGEVSIVASDVPLVLRISFYYDNITFHPTENDQEEYFNKPNSYKSIMDSLQRYFYQRKNMNNFDPNQTKVTYNDFVEFSYFFIQSDDDLFLTQGGKEDPWVDNQETPLERELKENIEKYENLLKKATTAQEKQIIQSTIDNLKAQLALLQNKGDKSKGGKNKAQITKDQIRMSALKEAFKFYSIQQNATGVKFTFERIIHEQNVINLACFLLFLKHFGILGKNKYVTKRELQNMFKKYALNYKELDLDHFKIMIEKVALAFYKEEENLSNIDKVEKLYQLLEIDNINKFRAKFSLLNQPFRIQVKDGFRLLPFDQGREIVMKKIDPEVKEKIKERKEMKKINSIQMFNPADRETLKTLEGSKMPHSTQVRRHTQDTYQQSSIYSSPGAANYANRKLKQQQGKIEQAGKVSWQQLEKQSFSDMKNINNGQFKPTDLFNEEDDEEDKIYLAEYNLQDDRQRKMQESIMNKKGQENYGTLKESIRPSLRYLQKQNPEYGKNTYSPSNGNLQRNVPEYYSPQHISSKQQSINQSYMQRAQQVDQDQRQREKELIKFKEV